MKNLYKIENELYIVDNTEEINKDTKTCWCIDISCNELVLHQGGLPSYHYKHYKKIIMTTDKSINVLCSCGKDCGAKESGVQAIDDEFLEWFVKNPSCDFIEIESQCLIEEKCTCDSINSICKKPYYTLNYGIVIPSNNDLKIGDNTNFGIVTDINEKSVCFGKNKIGVDVWYKKSHVIKFPKLILEEPTEKTLEEAISNYIYKTDSKQSLSDILTEAIKFGVKWQSERMYNEGDVKDFISDWTRSKDGLNINLPLDKFEEWFEKNKKK